MARPIAYPAPVNTAYAGYLSDVRHDLDEWYDWVLHSPKAKTDLANQIKAWAGAAGVSLNVIPSNQALVTNGDTNIPLGDATAVANGQDTGTAAVASGAITRITLPSTDKIVKSGVKYLGPAITGTYTNGYTLTIVNGAITAIAAS